MSTLSQFAPFAGGGLKSFQTGYANTTNATSGSGEDARYLDVTISSVSTTKAIPCVYGTAMAVNFFGFAASMYFFASGAQGNPGMLLPRLTSSTNLRLSCNIDVGQWQGTNTAITGRWQVAEAN
jgi:hypothetical protein